MIGATLLIGTGCITVLVLTALAYRAVRQRRVARGLAVATPPGVVESGYVRIGGIEQWIQIRGEHRHNPVLLVLHGGPGMSYLATTPLLRAWEKHFTVVQWDRRGTGKTFGRNGRAGSQPMTFDQLVDDGIEVAEYLCRRLNQDKVIVLASSMGTLVGVPMVQRRPDLFHAYVGTDQYVDVARNEAESYRMTLDRARAAGSTAIVTRLEKIGADPSRWSVRDWQVKQQCTAKTDPVIPGGDMKLLMPLVLTHPAYRLRDILHLGAGAQFSTTQLLTQAMGYDAHKLGTRFAVPFFLLQGETDVMTLTGLAQEYFAEVQAPVQDMTIIPATGHLAAFFQPEAFLAALIIRVRPLAATPGAT
jgi:pimeloyl-ACP methyl ester carboxylesterase